MSSEAADLPSSPPTRSPSPPSPTPRQPGPPPKQGNGDGIPKKVKTRRVRKLTQDDIARVELIKMAVGTHPESFRPDQQVGPESSMAICNRPCVPCPSSQTGGQRTTAQCSRCSQQYENARGSQCPVAYSSNSLQRVDVQGTENHVTAIKSTLTFITDPNQAISTLISIMEANSCEVAGILGIIQIGDPAKACKLACLLINCYVSNAARFIGLIQRADPNQAAGLLNAISLRDEYRGSSILNLMLSMDRVTTKNTVEILTQVNKDIATKLLKILNAECEQSISCQFSPPLPCNTPSSYRPCNSPSSSRSTSPSGLDKFSRSCNTPSPSRPCNAPSSSRSTSPSGLDKSKKPNFYNENDRYPSNEFDYTDQLKGDDAQATKTLIEGNMPIYNPPVQQHGPDCECPHCYQGSQEHIAQNQSSQISSLINPPTTSTAPAPGLPVSASTSPVPKTPASSTVSASTAPFPGQAVSPMMSTSTASGPPSKRQKQMPNANTGQGQRYAQAIPGQQPQLTNRQNYGSQINQKLVSNGGQFSQFPIQNVPGGFLMGSSVDWAQYRPVPATYGSQFPGGAMASGATYQDGVMGGVPQYQSGPIRGVPQYQSGPPIGGPRHQGGPMAGGAQYQGGPMPVGAQYQGGPMPVGAQYQGGPMPVGAQYQGGPMPVGAQYQGGPMACGAQSQGGPMTGGAQYQGGPMVGGAQYQGGPIAGGAQYPAGPMAGGAQYQGGPMVGGAQYQGGTMVGGAQYQGGPTPLSAQYSGSSNVDGAWYPNQERCQASPSWNQNQDRQQYSAPYSRPPNQDRQHDRSLNTSRGHQNQQTRQGQTSGCRKKEPNDARLPSKNSRHKTSAGSECDKPSLPQQVNTYPKVRTCNRASQQWQPQIFNVGLDQGPTKGPRTNIIQKTTSSEARRTTSDPKTATQMEEEARRQEASARAKNDDVSNAETTSLSSSINQPNAPPPSQSSDADGTSNSPAIDTDGNGEQEIIDVSIVYQT